MRMTRYPIRLNGIALDALDKRIFVTDIKEAAPKIKVTTDTSPLGGMRVVRREITERSVTVRYVIWERDKAARNALHRLIVEWADAGGVLSVGYRDAQTLRVLCDKLPDISSKTWDDEMELTLTAYDPYWQSVDAMTAAANVAANTATGIVIHPDGSADTTPLLLDILNNASAAMTSATVAVGGKSIALGGFSLAAGKHLIADYDDYGYLRIRADGVSVLSARSAASADELLLEQRKSNTVTVTVNQAARVTLKAYARWK